MEGIRHPQYRDMTPPVKQKRCDNPVSSPWETL